MHTHKEALIILNCSKMTLSRYVKDGKLTREKKGRRTYYDEHEVAALVKEIEDNKNKYRPDVPKREKKRIELPDEVKELCENIISDDNLTKVGYEHLAEATENLKRLKLYDDADKEILILYALSIQNFYKYLYLSNEHDGIFINDSGSVSVHPYHKIMMDHQKMMMHYSDRLGFNPLARTKFAIEDEEEIIDSIFDDDISDFEDKKILWETV